MLRDPHIRSALASSLDPTTGLILHEIGILQGSTIVDVAHLGDSTFAGFEIKSDVDSLARIDRQVHAYATVFDAVSIVVGPKLLKAVQRRVPEWVGIIAADPKWDETSPGGFSQTEMFLINHRPSTPSPYVSPMSIAGFLWKPELIASLSRLGLAKGRRDWRIGKLRPVLVEALGDGIRGEVRRAIEARGDWKVENRRKRELDRLRWKADRLSHMRLKEWAARLKIQAG